MSKIKDIIVKAITDFNIRDSGGMDDTKNVLLSVADAEKALIEHFDSVIGEDELPAGTRMIGVPSYQRDQLRAELKKRIRDST